MSRDEEAARDRVAQTIQGRSLKESLAGSLAIEDEAQVQSARDVAFEELSERNAKKHQAITRMTGEITRLQQRLGELQEASDELEQIPPFLREAAALNYRKSQDYGTEGDLSKRRYNPFGIVSYLHMLHLKLNRLTSVLTRGGVPNFESARDTLLDSINYHAYLGAYLDEEAAADEARNQEEWAVDACDCDEPELHAREMGYRE